MKKDEKFSVLMSVYFKENPNYLDLSLKSILIDQTILPTEVILIEDGKLTDELDNIILKYKNKFPKILKIYPFKNNQGLGKALEIGLKKCKYNIVMRMDTDDIAVKNRFELQLNYMKLHRDVSACGGFIAEFDKDPYTEELRIKKMPLNYQEVVQYAKFRNPLNHMTVCFRKKDILDVGNYQPLFYLEDHYLWSRLLVNGKKIENIPEVLVYARIGDGFLERRGNKKYLDGWKKLQSYMYDNDFINLYEKCRNTLGMFVMTHVSSNVRSYLYNNILREKKKTNIEVVNCNEKK